MQNIFVSLNLTLIFACFIVLRVIFNSLLSFNTSYGFISILNQSTYFMQILLCILIYNYCLTDIICLQSFDGTIVYGGSNFIVIFLTFFACFFSVLSAKFLTKIHAYFFEEYLLLIAFAILGLIFFCVSSNLILAFLALELQSLSFYLLATFLYTSEYNVQAGLKYFLLGALASIFLLFGFLIIYVTIGTFSYEAIHNTCKLISNVSLLILGAIIAIFLTFLFKIGAAPYHLWLCDVYENVPTTVTLFYSSVPKITMLYLIAKFAIFLFLPQKSLWSIIMLFFGITSIITGSVVAIFQKRIKRLLAFATVSHTGFMVLALCCGNFLAVQSFLIYIVIYIFINLGTFSLIFLTTSETSFYRYIINWVAFAKQNLIASISLCLFLYASAGIPPLAGFFSKLLVFLSLLTEQYFVTCLLLIFFSSVACYYYIRIIKILYFSSLFSKFWINSGSRFIEFSMVLSLFFVIFFIMYPNCLLLMPNLLSIAVFNGF